MGSELQLTTALGIGSTFTFVLTLGTVGTPPDPPRQQLTAQPLRALVIGGRPALQDLLTRVCAQFGWSVQTRGAANRALDGTADATAADTFDVVLVDLSSPQVEGLGELRRDHPRGTALIALTTQSGVASLPEKDASLLDGYVIKPFTPSSLLDAVVSARGPGGGPSPSAGRRARVVPRLTGVRVLVVDDNETTREVAAEMLRHEEAVVRLASNGREAVDLVLADPAGVDVVLMDQQMPIMDGLAATRALRAHPAVDRLPVVALTANTTEADRRECLDAGMSDHLSKPFDLDDLVDRVRYWATLTPEAGAPNGTSRGPDVPQEAPAPGSATLDTAAALARVAGNEDFYARTLARFAGGLQERLTDIAAALAEDDRTRAARLAHTLSGAAATVGAMSLGEAARALEAALSEATDAGPARVALTDAAARTASAITAYVGDRAERVGNHLGS
jgi:CheY-like chemotaxis protein